MSANCLCSQRDLHRKANNSNNHLQTRISSVVLSHSNLRILSNTHNSATKDHLRINFLINLAFKARAALMAFQVSQVPFLATTWDMVRLLLSTSSHLPVRASRLRTSVQISRCRSGLQVIR